MNIRQIVLALEEVEEKLNIQTTHEQELKTVMHKQLESIKAQSKEWENKYLSFHRNFQLLESENKELRIIKDEYKHMQKIFFSILL